LLESRPVLDAHVDAIGFAADLGHDLTSVCPGQFDLERGVRAGLGAWVVVCWPDPGPFPPGPLAPREGQRSIGPSRSRTRTIELLTAAHALEREHPGRFRLVGNGLELDSARATGRVAGIPGIEGGHALDEDPGVLEWFFERGVRLLTLVWNNHLSWVRSCQECTDPRIPAGLSALGREFVGVCNRLGIVVDLSHAAPRSFFDALEVSRQPVIASHSGCHALHPHPRNLTDEQLRELGRAGGVVGLVFYPGFLDAEARAEEARVRATPAYRELESLEPSACFLARQALMRREAAPLAAERLVEHVLHAIEQAGIDHVGLGSDFDGIERGPAGLEDVSGYALLAELLAARGLSDEDLLKVLGGNMERVFRTVTGPGSAAASARRVAL